MMIVPLKDGYAIVSNFPDPKWFWGITGWERNIIPGETPQTLAHAAVFPTRTAADAEMKVVPKPPAL